MCVRVCVCVSVCAYHSGPMNSVGRNVANVCVCVCVCVCFGGSTFADVYMYVELNMYIQLIRVVYQHNHDIEIVELQCLDLCVGFWLTPWLLGLLACAFAVLASGSRRGCLGFWLTPWV